MMRGKTFNLDRQNGKLMGVCAGIANYTGWDATLVRAALVVATIAGGFPWTLIAYGIAAWVGKPQRQSLYGLDDRAPTRSSVADLHDSMRDLDRRMAEVDTIVAGADSRLAREIESLR